MKSLLCQMFIAKSIGERILLNRLTFGKVRGKSRVAVFLPGTVYISVRSTAYICMSKNRLTVSSRGVMSQDDNTGIPSQFTLQKLLANYNSQS